MDLVSSTVLVTLTSIAFSVLPFAFKGMRKHAKSLNLFGGLVLTVVLFFNVIPEMIEHGGAWSLLIVGAAFFVFTAGHLLTGRRNTSHAGHSHSEGSCASGYWLAGSVALHCLACGLLLCGSHEVSETFAMNVAVSLILHKAVEAFALSSLLLEKASSRRQLWIGIGVYTIAFPVGVAVAELGIGGEALEPIAIVATGLGVGALFGCLSQDVFLPALKSLRFYPFASKETI